MTVVGSRAGRLKNTGRKINGGLYHAAKKAAGRQEGRQVKRLKTGGRYHVAMEK